PTISSYSLFFFSASAPHPHLHSFPTRRSSDLGGLRAVAFPAPGLSAALTGPGRLPYSVDEPEPVLSPLPTTLSSSRARDAARRRDRKSTRLNSSHRTISYAVFCLKKKNHKKQN